MAYKGKPPELDMPGGRLRIMGREAFDRKAAVAVPSATGGAPKLNEGAVGGPIAPTPAEMGVYGERQAQRAMPAVLPFLRRGGRAIAEYAPTNQAFVEHMTQVYTEAAAADKDFNARLKDFAGPEDFAVQLLGMIQRAAALDAEPVDLPSAIYASRSGRQLKAMLDNSLTQGGW